MTTKLIKNTIPIKTPSDLKYLYEENNPNGHYFTRSSMRCFGDTMKNYKVLTLIHDNKKYYRLIRRNPVKHGMQNNAYFDEYGLQVLDSELKTILETL